jgi:hypothetical protein
MDPVIRRGDKREEREEREESGEERIIVNRLHCVVPRTLP